jgi:small subunit ribosomal protein S7
MDAPNDSKAENAHKALHAAGTPHSHAADGTHAQPVPAAEHAEAPNAEQKPEQAMVAKPSDVFAAKVFGKYSTREVKVNDISLAPYLNLEARNTPHSFGRAAAVRFGKGKVSVVERLINKIMRSGQGKRKMSGKYIRSRWSTGKKINAITIVEKAFEIIARETKQNPVQVLITALENSAIREDTTRIKKGGVAYSVSVDVSPMRRLDESIKNLALAGYASSYNTKTSASEGLAKELILAAKGDAMSYSIKRRDEVERVAMASR